MCRIAGIIDRSAPVTATQAKVREMCRLLQAGGPDGEGIYTDEAASLVLGNRRLSILDLGATGNQPMSWLNQRYWITYNGELYNYPELKAALLKEGCHFNSTGDTEVILAAFATWGEAAFRRFNGMFAFALWDTVAGSLYLVRDPSGIKPLYYAITATGLAFASEIKAFAAIPELQTPQNNWPVYLMAYGHLPEPVTTLRDVQPIAKGSWLKYLVNEATFTKESYNRFSYLEKISNRSEAIGRIREGLEQAVERQLLSDAPIGVFLSGGLDSGILTRLAAKHRQPLHTVSLYFNEQQYSEKQYQEMLVQGLNGCHHHHLLTEADFHDHFPSILAAMDLPSCDGINSWFISKFARANGLKAVLSGLGGDELFGGYPSFNRIRTALFFEKLPNSVLRAGKFSLAKKYRRLVYLSLGGAVGKYLFLRGLFTPDEIASRLGAYEVDIWKILEEQPHLPNIEHLTPQNQVSWLESNLYMQNQLLRDSDVMSMAHGLEIRVPFLDAAFIRLVIQIESGIKYGGGLNKQLLIDCFKDILPEQVYNRPKMGFAFPFKEWLANNQYARQLLGENNNQVYQQFVSGELHWSQYLTTMLIARNQHG